AGVTGMAHFQYDDAGTAKEIGRIYGNWAGGANLATIWLEARRQAGDSWPEGVVVRLAARDDVAATDVRIDIKSAGRIEVSHTLAAGKGLYVGATGGAPGDNDIICEGTIATASGEEWNLGGTAGGTVTPDTKVHVEIDGNWFTLVAQAGLL
ncbi:unnamed protein product, partial [marine sediment metagenome]